MLNVYHHDSFFQGYSIQGSIESGDIHNNLISDSTVSCAEKTEFHSYDTSTFSKQNKTEALKDTIDLESNYDFCSNIVPSNNLQSINNYKKKSAFLAPIHMEKFPLNPEAAEYKPFKQSISQCSTSNQEMSNLGDSPPPLYNALSERRQDLSSYYVSDLDSPAVHYFDNRSVQSHTSNNQESQKVDEIQSNSNKIQTESQSFINNFNGYFCNELTEGDYEDILKSYSSLKYLLQQMNFNHSVSVQVGTPAASMVSQGVMTHDEDLETIIVDSCSLKGHEQKIIEEKKLLEEQLSIALDEQAKLQHRYQVAMLNWKKEIQDCQETFANKMKDMKEKETILVKDVKTWRKKYDEIVEEKKELERINKIQKLELENHEKKSVSYDEEVVPLARDIQYINKNKSDLSRLYENCLKHEASAFVKTEGVSVKINSKSKNYELSGFPVVSGNSLLSNDFERSSQNVLNSNAQELSLLYTNKYSYFNSVLEQQCFSQNQNSNQQMQTNSFCSQNLSQNYNFPVSDNLLSYSSLLPEKDISGQKGVNSELFPNASSIQQCPDQMEKRTVIYPSALTCQNSHSELDISSAITQLNVSQEPNSLKSPNAIALSMCSLDDVDLPLSLPSTSEHSARSSPFSKSVLEEETAMKPSTTHASKISAKIFPLEFDYSGPQSVSADTTVSDSKVGDVTSSDVYTKASKNKMNKGIARVLDVLQLEFPDKKEDELMTAIKAYRERKGPLTNLSIFTVIEDIKKTLKQVKSKRTPATADSNAQVGRPKILVNKPLTLPSTSVVLPSAAPKAWAKINFDDKQPNSWTAPMEKNQCSICLERMNEKSTYKVDCGHLFHFMCIKKWLANQRNCPECRTFLLLPDDFPSL